MTQNDEFDSSQSRQDQYGYDRQGRKVSHIDAQGGETTWLFDGNGNVIEHCDARNNCLEHVYNSFNQLIQTTAVPANEAVLLLSTLTYDPGGRLLTRTDRDGTTVLFGYDDADREVAATIVDMDGTGRDVRIHETTYDERGLATHVYEGGDVNGAHLRLRTNYYNLAGWLWITATSRTGGDLVTAFAYTDAGRLLYENISHSGVVGSTHTSYDYTNGNRTKMIELLDGVNDPVTEYGYDGFGRLVFEIDANGNRTDYHLDAAGRVIKVERAAVAHNGAASSVRPESLVGYDVWGNVTHTKDAYGRITVTTWDDLDRPSTITHPIYTTPDGVTIVAQEIFNYDANGNLESQTTRRGYTIVHEYDFLNRVIQTKNEAGHYSYVAYDDGLNTVTHTSETGAVTVTAYNDLDLIKTVTEVVRAVTLPGSGITQPAASFSTHYGYDDLANLTVVTTPLGLTTTYGYDETANITSVTDDAGVASTFTHNHLGQVLDAVDPEGRINRSVYDPLGRLTHSQQIGNQGGVRNTYHGYLPGGQLYWTVTEEGGQSVYTYDSFNRLSTVTVYDDINNPTSGYLSAYGYSYNNVLTWQRSPNGDVTIHSANVWDLVETTVEPATAQHPNAVDRTFTYSYDADGRLAKTAEPGGVAVTISRIETGQIQSETGSDGSTRSFTYNPDGTVASAASITGPLGFTYNDRGQIVESTSGVNRTNYFYDADGRLTARNELLYGTYIRNHQYTWTNQNELATHTDPVAGTTSVYAYNNASQLVTLTRAGSTRTVVYNQFGETYIDKLEVAGNQLRVQNVYVYDGRGDVISNNEFLWGMAQRHYEYDYDRAGRLTNWTIKDHITNTVIDDYTYTYDNAGNRETETSNTGTKTWTYDERNRLITGPDSTSYVWNPNGTLQYENANGTYTHHIWDALGRLKYNGNTGNWKTFVYDSFDRLAHRYHGSAWQIFTYNDTNQNTTSSVNSAGELIIYGRSPTGRATSVQDANGNQRHIGQNRHGDLQSLTNNAGTATTKSITYTPYGKQHDQAGTDPTPPTRLPNPIHRPHFGRRADASPLVLARNRNIQITRHLRR